MGDIVKLPPRYVSGNGARDALQRYFDEDTFHRYHKENENDPHALCAGDHLLAWLWEQGFKIGPHNEDTRPPWSGR